MKNIIIKENILKKIIRHIKTSFSAINKFKSNCQEFGKSIAITILKRNLGLINVNNYISLMSEYTEIEINEVIMKYKQNKPVVKKKIICNSDIIPIWVMWFQGEEYLPDLCKACINRIKEIKPDNTKVIILTKSNYLNYAEIPKDIVDKFNDKKIGIANYSDIIRYNLLSLYGGAWIDAAIYLSNNIIEEAFKYPLYTPKFCNSDYILEDASRGKWVGGCWFSKEPNILFKFTFDSLIHFWRNHDRAYEYLMCDYIIYNAYKNFDSIKNELDQVPMNSLFKRELNKHFCCEYSEALWQKLIEQCSIHLLNRHIEYPLKTSDGEKTIYCHMLEEAKVL